MDIMQTVMEGKDCLGVMPTGGGKSMCFSLPALCKPGFAIVVSPLLALQQDQVASLVARGVVAAALSSATPAAERSALMSDLASNQPSTKLLFCTPELLSTETFRESLLKMAPLSLLAIDEAHCISSWGHDFRPAYRKLGYLRRRFPRVPCLALTATADQKVREDVMKQLSFGTTSRCFVDSFNRPNITYSVRYADLLPLEDRIADIAELMSDVRGDSREQPSALIYVLKRDEAATVAAALTRRGVSCSAYHAGLRDAERGRVLKEWSNGQLPCIAATVAFGMGIDRGAVRLVIHYSLPKTMSGFSQESGRAGRDGLPAQSVVYYFLSDRRRMDYITLKEGKSSGKRRRNGKPASPSGPSQGNGDNMAAARAFGEVVQFATTARCRRAVLLGHFGETLPKSYDRSNCCDYCSDSAAVQLQLSKLEAKTTATGGQRAVKGGHPGVGVQRQPPLLGCLTGHDSEAWAAGLSDNEDAGAVGAGSGSQSEEASSGSDRAAAANAVGRARARGSSLTATVAALERAEEVAHPGDELNGRGRGLSHRLKAATDRAVKALPLTKPLPAAVSDEARSRAIDHLRKALLANSRLQLLPQPATSAAQALEAKLHHSDGRSISAALHRSKLAASLRAVSHATSLEALSPAAAAAVAAASSAEDFVSSAQAAPHSTSSQLAATSSPGQPCTRAAPDGDAAGSGGNVSVLPIVRQEPDSGLTNAVQTVEAAPAVVEDPQLDPHLHQQCARLLADAKQAAAGGRGDDGIATAVAALQKLQDVAVTAQFLTATGFGKQLNRFKFHANAAIRGAASAAIIAWKEHVSARQ